MAFIWSYCSTSFWTPSCLAREIEDQNKISRLNTKIKNTFTFSPTTRVGQSISDQAV